MSNVPENCREEAQLNRILPIEGEIKIQKEKIVEPGCLRVWCPLGRLA
jgi:hypothetical protein